MSSQLLALQIVIPLTLTPLCAYFRNGRISWLIALVGATSAFVCSILLTHHVMTEGELDYFVGGWEAPWGISIHVDALSALVLLLISGSAALVLLPAWHNVEMDVPRQRQGAFYTAYLAAMTAMIGITVSGDAFNVFVFLEIASLSIYALLALGTQRLALLATFRYLVQGTVGATFILIGIGLLYAQTGTLNMADLGERLPPLRESPLSIAAVAFFLIGTAIKAALFPLHHWLTNTYYHAPMITTAFIGATATKVAAYIMLRFVLDVFGMDWVMFELSAGPLLAAAALVGILLGSGVAVSRHDIKMLLAYSSIGQLGYIFLPMALGTEAGTSAAVLHIFNHGLIKAALWMALACLLLRLGSLQLHHLYGIGPRLPWSMAALTVGSLSLMGLPGTAGFVSKWYLFSALFDAGWWPAIIIVAISSLLGVLYVWRVLEMVWLGKPSNKYKNQKLEEAPWLLLGTTWILAGMNIYFGFATHLPVALSEMTAAMITGGQ